MRPTAAQVKAIAATHKATIKLVRKDSGFFVDVPDKFNQRHLPDFPKGKFEDYPIDDDEAEYRERLWAEFRYEERAEEEKWSYMDEHAESMALCEEEGWFYSDCHSSEIWSHSLHEIYMR